jgi:hypothetical protein
MAVSYYIEALDPPTHSYDVRIDTPAGTGLAVWLTSSDGWTLQVTQDTLKVNEQDCSQQDGRLSCVLHFPALEARQGGAWTVHVLKHTSPAATVTITITFMTLG